MLKDALDHLISKILISKPHFQISSCKNKLRIQKDTWLSSKQHSQQPKPSQSKAQRKEDQRSKKSLQRQSPRHIPQLQKVNPLYLTFNRSSVKSPKEDDELEIKEVIPLSKFKSQQNSIVRQTLTKPKYTIKYPQKIDQLIYRSPYK